MTDDAISGAGMKQATLDGDEADRVECEYYDGCKSPALYIDEILHYGEGEKPVKMCEGCAEEHLEAEGNEVQRLKPEDRYIVEEPSKPSVWVVSASIMDDPHPRVLGVYDNEEAAKEHEREIKGNRFMWDGLPVAAFSTDELAVASEVDDVR